jgi:tetratricopeptide (TPR) repeat protein
MAYKKEAIMLRMIITISMIILLNVAPGCRTTETGRGQLMPDRTKTSLGSAGVFEVAGTSESDIVEQIAVHRQAYRQGLKLLIEHYKRMGNNRKLEWAEKELKAFDAIPQYKYIIDAEVAGPNLRASTSIPVADELYMDAVELHNQGDRLPLLKDADLLRIALDRYNQLIRKYPSSDKIDDAAYKGGQIYEYFRDYTIALTYYQRAYQWDPATIYPARFKAAYILDKRLHRRNEALKLYQEAIRKESRYEEWKEFAENRIRELTGTQEGAAKR